MLKQTNTPTSRKVLKEAFSKSLPNIACSTTQISNCISKLFTKYKVLNISTTAKLKNTRKN